MKRFMIIDGSSLLYRAFFAMPPLKNARGIPTNAVYGFLNMFSKVYEELKPDFVAVTFDKGRETFRKEMYPEYKENRSSAPEELRPQFALIREVLSVLGIHALEMDGFEGDDLIGSLTKKFEGDDCHVMIVSGDRDILQLVDANTHVFITRKGISEMDEVTVDNMVDLYGYSPKEVPDMKGLMGDSSDNIPGVPGVGEKTALKFITAYGSIDGLYEHIEDIKGKMKERLIDNKEMAYLSKELATIKTDIPLDFEESYFTMNLHAEEMKALFSQLGFTRIIPKFMKLAGAPEVDGGDLFASLMTPSAYQKDAVKEMPSPSFGKGKSVSILFATKDEVPYLSLEHVVLYDGETLYAVPNEKLVLADVLAICNGAERVVTVDSKNLWHGLSSVGELAFLKEGAVHVFDMTLLSYLLDPTRTNYGNSYLCERFQLPMIDGTDPQVERQQMACALMDMLSLALNEAKEYNIYSVYETIELPLVRTLAIMEKRGIYIDQEALTVLKTKFVANVEALQREIYELAGEEFNINSPKQLGVVLFEGLQLPVIKKTKTGYSTNAEVLDQLRYEHPIIEKIMEYRGVSKLLSTYVEGLYPLIDQKTSRIHTTFNQMVTATGRLSSSNPNLQNIPVRTKQGREIRALFLPGEGYQYLTSADYSQIELRILAHMSQDPGLLKAFADGMDIHRFTAAEVLGKVPEDVTAEERSHAKAVNFGIIYGLSEFGLSRDLGITRQAAKEYIEAYFNRYPSVKGFMDTLIADAREKGYVRTQFGRIRQLEDINNRNFMRRAAAERMAMNTPIQGTAADIIKMAMNKVEKKLEEEKFQSRILLQVHDELVLEVVDAEREAVEKLLKETMEDVVSLNVPLVVDVHTAKDWADVK